jgi:hypothetical protein
MDSLMPVQALPIGNCIKERRPIMTNRLKHLGISIASGCLMLTAMPAHAQPVGADSDLEAPITIGVHHVGLAVTDLDASTRFFVDGLGWQLGGRDPSYPAAFVTDGSVLVSLWQVEDPATAVPFNRRRNVGLHHLALEVADTAMLERLHKRLTGMKEDRICART